MLRIQLPYVFFLLAFIAVSFCDDVAANKVSTQQKVEKVAGGAEPALVPGRTKAALVSPETKESKPLGEEIVMRKKRSAGYDYGYRVLGQHKLNQINLRELIAKAANDVLMEIHPKLNAARANNVNPLRRWMARNAKGLNQQKYVSVEYDYDYSDDYGDYTDVGVTREVRHNPDGSVTVIERKKTPHGIVVSSSTVKNS